MTASNRQWPVFYLQVIRCLQRPYSVRRKLGFFFLFTPGSLAMRTLCLCFMWLCDVPLRLYKRQGQDQFLDKVIGIARIDPELWAGNSWHGATMTRYYSCLVLAETRIGFLKIQSKDELVFLWDYWVISQHVCSPSRTEALMNHTGPPRLKQEDLNTDFTSSKSTAFSFVRTSSHSVFPYAFTGLCPLPWTPLS